MKPLHIISLGAGVQSSAMALMAAHGEITPMPDAAIFADTQAEPPSVYRWLDWLEKQLPFPVHRVTAGNLTKHCLMVHRNKRTGTQYYSTEIPAFILNPDGTVGKVQRHCTFNFKIKPITPITRKQRALAGIARWGQNDTGTRVVQWIGISMDEARRCAPSREPWCESRWPLIELRIPRWKCGAWMVSHGYPEPPRSACVFCPFHRDDEWRRLKMYEPEAFAQAVAFERRLQTVHSSVQTKGTYNGIPYLTKRCQPLETINFLNDSDRRQKCLWEGEACGVCGV